MNAWMAVAALAVMVGCNGAYAADGNELLLQCQATVKRLDGDTSVDRLDVGLCLGMVEGVRTMMIIDNEALPANLKNCLPEQGINNGQAARIVAKFLQENPAVLHLPAVDLTRYALMHAFPCK